MNNYTNEQLINKIADIRYAIPIEMFDEIHPSALGASVGCPYEALCFIEEIVKGLVKDKSEFNAMFDMVLDKNTDENKLKELANLILFRRSFDKQPLLSKEQQKEALKTMWNKVYEEPIEFDWLDSKHMGKL